MKVCIHDKIDWERHPVIKIEWSKIKHASPQEMEESMSGHLGIMATGYQISLTQKYASDRFDELIIRLHEKFGKRVVILVDEYDMPILDALKKPDNLDDT